MTINQVQKKVVSVIVPIIIILLGFAIIGSSGSTSGSHRFGGGGGITFNPFGYLESHGGEWSLVVLLIGVFEFFWWRDPKKKTEQS